jgi:hypothetical protein
MILAKIGVHELLLGLLVTTWRLDRAAHLVR